MTVKQHYMGIRQAIPCDGKWHPLELSTGTGGVILWVPPGAPALAVVSRDEAACALGTLTDEQLDTLDSAYVGDAWAFGKAIAWKYAEAIRRGWLLGPA